MLILEKIFLMGITFPKQSEWFQKQRVSCHGTHSKRNRGCRIMFCEAQGVNQMAQEASVAHLYVCLARATDTVSPLELMSLEERDCVISVLPCPPPKPGKVY